MICFGIVEGRTPCFVYRRKAEDLDPRAPSFLFFFSIIILIGVLVNSKMVTQMDFWYLFI